MEELYLDCSACRTAGSMAASRVSRFSEIVRVIGFILVIPSVVGMVIAGFLLVGFIAGTAGSPVPQSEAELAGRTIGSLVAVVVIAAIGVGSLVSGLLGWLLLLKRKVFKCGRCGFILDRD
jgi:hypothetical protein